MAVGSSGLAAALVMADAAIRFPAVLDPRAPGGAGRLALVALLAVLVGLTGELLGPADRRRASARAAAPGPAAAFALSAARYSTQTGVPSGALP